MELLYLLMIFATVVIALLFHRPLYQAVLCALFVCCVLFGISPDKASELTIKVLTQWSSLSVLVSLYLIVLLQHILEKRDQITLAQKDLDSLFHNRRINASIAPIFIGLLPHAGAMILCSDIVKESTDPYLKPEEQAFVTSWFRHIPESTLPTYTGVILMSTLSGIPLNRFVPAMIVPVIVLFLIGYLPFLRRLPKSSGSSDQKDRMSCLINLVKHLWTLILVLVLILVFKLSVVSSLLIVIVLSFFIYRFSLSEIVDIIKGSFVIKLLLNSFMVLVLKEFISYTEVLTLLPSFLSKLPIPAYMVFALLFFFGGIISGTTAIIALGTPIAFAALEGSVPLMVLLMCMSHGASQISPIHVCLVVASEHFRIPLTSLIRKTIPYTLLFCLFALIYYNILMLL